jgi:hypothetical protein
VESAEGLVLEDGSIVEAPDGRRGVFVINKLVKRTDFCTFTALYTALFQ